jgi:precorrin-6B methylase 2
MTAFIPALRSVAALSLHTLSLAALSLMSQTAFAQGSFGPYVPTPTVIVDRLLDMGSVSAKDYLIDLGSGDGRIVITAAKKLGTRGHGIDIQDKLVALANQNAAAEGVADKVKFVRGDIMEADLSQASIITTYLLPSTITKLVPKFLAELKPGTRIVSHDYPINPLAHERVVSFDLEEKIKISGTTLTVIYLYIIPARVSGEWNLNLAPAGAAGKPVTVRIDQRPESISGSVEMAGARIPLRDLKVSGEEISFAYVAGSSGVVSLRGTVRDGEMSGTVVSASTPVKTWSARRK